MFKAKAELGWMSASEAIMISLIGVLVLTFMAVQARLMYVLDHPIILTHDITCVRDDSTFEFFDIKKVTQTEGYTQFRDDKGLSHTFGPDACTLSPLFKR